jgi:predicted transposase/invertase (TIGR01784 family)
MVTSTTYSCGSFGREVFCLRGRKRKSSKATQRRAACADAQRMSKQPHDGLFKAIFGQLDYAREELRSLLPTEISAAIDWSTLSLEPGTFVDAQLSERETDLLYRMQLNERDAHVYVLFEHQSEVDARMPFRLLRYEIRIWEAWEKANPGAPLPPIIPIVLSQAKGGWTAATNFESALALQGAPAALLRFVPKFDYLVDDIGLSTDQALDLRLSKLLSFTMKLLRDLRERGVVVLWEQADAFRSLEENNLPTQTLGALIRYIVVVTEDARSVQRFLEHHELKKSEAVMRSIAQQWIDEGIERGIEQGIERGIEQGIPRGVRVTLRKLLLLKFPTASDAALARLEDVDLSTLEKWSERVLWATSIEDVFA